MRNCLKLLFLTLFFTSFFPLAAAHHTRNLPPETHIGPFLEFSTDSHLAVVIYPVEGQPAAQLFFVELHIDPTNDMVNGFAGWFGYVDGMNVYVGDFVETLGVDAAGTEPIIKNNIFSRV